MLEITSTTDGRFLGMVIDKDARPLMLDDDYSFWPDKVVEIASGIWRLSNTNYVIDAKEQ